MRSALLAADLVLIPAQPSPFDGWASAEMLKLIDEARISPRQLVARFVLNRCAARTVIARETAAALADHDPPVLANASASASASPMPRRPVDSSGRSVLPNQPPATPTDSPTKSGGSGDDDSHRRQSHERGR